MGQVFIQIRSTKPKKCHLYSLQVTVGTLGETFSCFFILVHADTRCQLKHASAAALNCKQLHANPWRSCLLQASLQLRWQSSPLKEAALQRQGVKGRVGSRTFVQSPFYNGHVFTQAQRRCFLRGKSSHLKFLPLSAGKGLMSHGAHQQQRPCSLHAAVLSRLRLSRQTLPGNTVNCRGVIAVNQESSCDHNLEEATSCRLS